MNFPEDLYMVGVYENGVLQEYLYTGRPSTIRVYESYDGAKRGIIANKKFYGDRHEFKIFMINGLTGVVEE